MFFSGLLEISGLVARLAGGLPAAYSARPDALPARGYCLFAGHGEGLLPIPDDWGRVLRLTGIE